MKGLRVDSFLQCIPPGRLGYLFCKIHPFKLKPTSFSSVGRQGSSLSIHSSYWGIPALVECLVGESVESATLYAPGEATKKPSLFIYLSSETVSDLAFSGKTNPSGDLLIRTLYPVNNIWLLGKDLLQIGWVRVWVFPFCFLALLWSKPISDLIQKIHQLSLTFLFFGFHRSGSLPI